MTHSIPSGPIDANDQFPSTLTGRVVTPGAHPRIHGYDVEQDLARHYGLLDTAFLALTGNLPTEETSRALTVALQFVAGVAVNEAPSHVAVLARLSGARSSTLIGAAAIALAEQARVAVAAHTRLFEWLRAPTGSLPAEFTTQSEAERAAVQHLEVALPSALHLPLFSGGPTRQAAVLAVLFSCGLDRPEQLESMLVVARLPTALAEGFAERATLFQNYPINLPRFHYPGAP